MIEENIQIEKKPSKKDQRAAALDRLKPIERGTTLFCVVRARTESGNRHVSVHHIIDVMHRGGGVDTSFNLSYNLAKALGMRYSEHNAAVVVDEIGTEACALIVRKLSEALFGDPNALRVERM